MFWKASLCQGCSRRGFCFPEIYIPAELIDAPLQRNAKAAFIFEFHEGFLRIGVTKYCKLHYKMPRGSSAGTRNTPRPVYPRPLEPLQINLFGELKNDDQALLEYHLQSMMKNNLTAQTWFSWTPTMHGNAKGPWSNPFRVAFVSLTVSFCGGVLDAWIEPFLVTWLWCSA